MKIVVEQYAMAILATMIALLLFIVCYHAPIFDGGVADLFWQPQLETTMSIAFDENMNRKAPVVVLRNAYALKAGQEVETKTIFSGFSWEGADVPVSVEKIYSEDFGMVLQDLSTGNGSICIESAGIYWVLAEAADSLGKPCRVLVKLFVNER